MSGFAWLTWERLLLAIHASPFTQLPFPSVHSFDVMLLSLAFECPCLLKKEILLKSQTVFFWLDPILHTSHNSTYHLYISEVFTRRRGPLLSFCRWGSKGIEKHSVGRREEELGAKIVDQLNPSPVPFYWCSSPTSCKPTTSTQSTSVLLSLSHNFTSRPYFTLLTIEMKIPDQGCES